MDKSKVVFYSKGCFIKDLNIRYEKGEVYAFSGQDFDYWSFFEACDLVKLIEPEFDIGGVKMRWKHDEGSFEQDLKPFRGDGDATELAMYAVGNKCEVEIFCEPKVVGEDTFMDKFRERGKGIKCGEDSDRLSKASDDSSDESLRGVHFDDSEEEGIKGFDEGLDEVFDNGVKEELKDGPVANEEVNAHVDKKIFTT
ncbi:unnamed protein product [Lathyrus sativus]|nr:unnamed protein product [Lathyrus sativus]